MEFAFVAYAKGGAARRSNCSARAMTGASIIFPSNWKAPGLDLASSTTRRAHSS